MEVSRRCTVVLLALLGAGTSHAQQIIDPPSLDNLRQHLLGHIDSATPPSTDGYHGIQVGLQLRIFKVLDLDVSTGRFVLKVWRRMLWYDSRLTWNPAEHGNVTEFCGYPNRRGGEGHYLDNNIWTPDIVLYNAIRTPDESLETGAVWIQPDGRVWYSVPGVVEVTCRFTGLAAFPHDEISCPMEFGSWSYSDLVTNLTMLNGGVEIAASNPTSGTTYQQYKLQRAEAWRTSRFYPCCAESPFSQIHIRIWLKRQARAYLLLLELPGIVLTCLSFLAFWLDVTQSGERLGFGVTLLLGNQLLMQIVATVTPLCGEMLWIDFFNWINFAFCSASIVESILAVYIAFGGIGTIRESAAEKLDYWSRRIIPTLYAICIGFIFNFKPDDGYLEEVKDKTTASLGAGDVAGMFEGIPPLWTINWGMVALAPTLIVGLGGLKCILDATTTQHKKLAISAKNAAVRTLKQSKTFGKSVGVDIELPSMNPEEEEEVDERALMRDLLEQMKLVTQMAAASTTSADARHERKALQVKAVEVIQDGKTDGEGSGTIMGTISSSNAGDPS